MASDAIRKKHLSLKKKTCFFFAKKKKNRFEKKRFFHITIYGYLIVSESMAMGHSHQVRGWVAQSIETLASGGTVQLQQWQRRQTYIYLWSNITCKKK